MPELRLGTVMIAIQSLRDTIEDLEVLLKSETLQDRAAIEELLVSYDRAAADLKEAYLTATRASATNYPPYEELLRSSSIRSAVRSGK